MPPLPTGTVTFLFSDIEGSTRLWELYPQEMRAMLVRQEVIIRGCVNNHYGQVFRTVGDAFYAVFPVAVDAVSATIAAQRALQAEDWGKIGPLRTRMALHTTSAEQRDGDYFGPGLNRVARLLAVGNGGQILLTAATAELVQESVPVGVSLRYLGERRLKDLIRPENIYQVVTPGLPDSFLPLKTPDNPSNLPTQLTSFIGREQALGELRHLLETTRLLTLMGAGGAGKTRLGIQLGSEVLELFEGGVWLVELAPVTDPLFVTQAIVSALMVREEPGQPQLEALITHFRSKEILLILDNCEHLIEPVAQLTADLLRLSSKLKILATSREALGVSGETTWRVPSLTIPDARAMLDIEQLKQSEAVRLFIDRAAAVQQNFSVTAQNAAALAQICQRLDGIPLAIELAAARVRGLSVEQIAARLDDRFKLLTGGSRTALPRQQTLRALVDWSYDLLAEEEKQVLRQLSVFNGSWSLEAAETILGDGGRGQESGVRSQNEEKDSALSTQHSALPSYEVLDLLLQLVNKSLVVLEEVEEQTRYRLLETIKQYGYNKLTQAGELQTLRQRHMDYYLGLAKEFNLSERESVALDRLDRLENEYSNLRAALEWAISQENVGYAIQLIEVLGEFWEIRGYVAEAREWLERILALSDKTELKLQARAYHMAGFFAHQQGDFANARPLLETALAKNREIGNEVAVAITLCLLGNSILRQGEYTLAQSLLEEATAIIKQTGDQKLLARSLLYLGIVLFVQGHYAEAHEILEECLQKGRAAGSKYYLTAPLNNLGFVAIAREDYIAARRYLEEAIAIERTVKSRSSILANALGNMAHIACTEGDYSGARALGEEALLIRQELGDKWGIAYSLGRFGVLAATIGMPERAARLWGAAEALRESIGTPLVPAELEIQQRGLELARAQLDEATFAIAWTEGRKLPLKKAITYALSA